MSVPEPGPPPDWSPRVARLALWLVLGLFLAVRVPVIYLQPGGQDEDYYAVPGLTVLSSGIPRLPNVPARNRESVFFKADEALFAEPPLYFYWQALFYAVLPDLYGTARLSTVVAGLISLAALATIGRLVTGRRDVGVMAALLCSFSRWFYFGAITARPDQLSGTFGLLAIVGVLLARRQETIHNTTRWLVLAGICIGCGGLSHLLAITYAIPIGLWVASSAQPKWRGIRDFVVVSGVSVAVALLWLPMIGMYPAASRTQFHNQFVAGSGDSLFHRLMAPGEALAYQGQGMIEFIGWPQVLLLAGSWLIGLFFSLRRRQSEWLWLIATAALSSFLLCVCLGRDHLGVGYWVVPAGLGYLCVASLIVRLATYVRWPDRAQRNLVLGVCGLLVAVHLPGGGLRTLLVHWQHRHDMAYNAPRFAQSLMEDIPREARCSVDAQFLLDFLASGRPTVNLQSMPKYFLTQDYPYDYMIVSRFGMAEGTAAKADGELWKTVGIKDDPFACYAEIYRPRSPHSGTEHAESR